MRNIVSTSIWLADEGKIFRRIKNNEYYGTRIDLGNNDSIENFKEVKLTKANDIEGLLNKKEENKKSSVINIFNKLNGNR